MEEVPVKSDKVSIFNVWRFCTAPMMDWTGPSQKAKLNQQRSHYL